MPDDNRFPREAWLPALTGLAWLWLGVADGALGALWSLLPGVLLLAGGVSMLLMPGDRRIGSLVALGGVVGMLFALPAALLLGAGQAFLLLLFSAAGAVAAGSHALRFEPSCEEVPEPEPTLALAAQVAIDEALLATILLTNPVPTRSGFARVRSELDLARAHFEAQGWLEKPVTYHETPPPLEQLEIRAASLPWLDYEHVSFESAYAPREGEPGRERWLGYSANRRAHAWMLRHRDRERPWLVCVHGFQMGLPWVDWGAFPPPWLHRRLGLNLLLPVLPLHGPRTVGRRSGDGFLAADPLDSAHAVAQTAWDLRRLLSWIRSQSSAPIGMLGYSLGGYATAVVASLDDQLACAIPGIPAVDLAGLFFRHGPGLDMQAAAASGVDETGMRELLRVVSPLALTPQLPRERRFLFGAVADRLVPPAQLRDLWRHWERPRLTWYQGGHVSFRLHASVRQLIETGLQESGVCAQSGA